MKKIFLLTISFILYSASTIAEDTVKKGPCAEDIQKFCANVEVGHGAIMKCLQQNETKLSSACKTKQKERMKAFQEKRENRKLKKEERKDRRKTAMMACKDDLEKFCKNISAGRGKKLRCLKEHQIELSNACKEALPQKVKAGS